MDPSQNPTAPPPATTGLTPDQTEGLRIFGYVSCAIAAVAAAVALAVMTAACFPALAAVAVAGVGALPLAAIVSIALASLVILATSFFGLQSLGRTRGQEDAANPL